MDMGQAQQGRVRGCSHVGGLGNALGMWTSFPGIPSLVAPCLLLSHRVGTKARQALGPCWAHWKAQDKVCTPSQKQKF